MRYLSLLVVVCLVPTLAAQNKDGNRLAYLDELNLYYPSHTFPKLITPQWVGDKDVEAVVILAIDDMKDSKKYETYLRPILDRLKKIDGRAPVSIMSCAVDPKDPQLQSWLKEGVSIECHTFDHPCPFFKHGFQKAKDTYEKCVDLMHAIPNNKPVAFRMPCCDSMNTPSPRFFAEIFNRTSDKKNYLTIDSSVFMAYTSKDPELPKNLVLDKDGKERFLEYFPKDRAFVNWIENYPYPYMIGRQCWQFPCMTPSDWQAQHRHKPFNPKTVDDWKAALDCTVIKKGVFTMVFHPHGWIKAEQVVELIDYAVAKYGKKVKFLNFGEALGRLEMLKMDANFLRLIAADLGNSRLPFALPLGAILPTKKQRLAGVDTGLRFHDLNSDGKLDLIFSNEKEYGIYLFTDMKAGWSKKVLAGKRGDKGELPMISRNGTNNGFFIHSGHFWWSNEDTALLKDFVDRRKIADLLKNVE